MKSINGLVLELSALKALEDHVKHAIVERKAEVAEQMRRGTISAFVDGGDEPADVGTVVVVADRFAWDVVDQAAFLAWVKKNLPSAIVESVRSSDQKAILAAIENGGEVPDGVARVKSNGYVSVKQTSDQRDALIEAAADGRLPAMPVLQIGQS